MKINIEINLPGVNEHKWEVVDYRRPQADEYYFNPDSPLTVQFCGSSRWTPFFILKEIKRPEETDIIWHPIDDLSKLEPQFEYTMLTQKNQCTKIHYYAEVIVHPDTNFKLWNYKYTHFAIIRKQALDGK